jgi:hypothetical protein
MDLGEVEPVNDDDPTPYHGVAELYGASDLTQSELKQVSREELFCFIDRHMDLSPFVHHDWRSMAMGSIVVQVPV